MKNFVSIVGNRPQLIKLDPSLDQKIIYTGQHYDKGLKDIFFERLGIPIPDEDLGLTELGEMIDKLIEVLPKYEPHYVIVYGDTRSTVAGALAAHQLGIPIIHVEAGCRSGNKNQIEERNRKLVDKISLIHLCPSLQSVFRLQDEGIGDNAYNVGCSQFSTLLKVLPTKRTIGGKYCVLTVHREENTDDPEKISDIFTGLFGYEGKVFFPVHPRTQEVMKKNKIIPPEFVRIMDPLPYEDFIHLVGHAEYLITDSGGAQAEAYFLRTPCITLRNETEWWETVDQNWNVLVGTDPEAISFALEHFNPSKTQHNSYAYGKGNTHKSIKAILRNL